MVREDHPISKSAKALGTVRCLTVLIFGENDEDGKIELNHEYTQIFGFISRSNYSDINEGFCASPIESRRDLTKHKAKAFRLLILAFLVLMTHRYDFPNLPGPAPFKFKSCLKPGLVMPVSELSEAQARAALSGGNRMAYAGRGAYRYECYL